MCFSPLAAPASAVFAPALPTLSYVPAQTLFTITNLRAWSVILTTGYCFADAVVLVLCVAPVTVSARRAC